MSAFTEAEHPRAADGKFTDKEHGEVDIDLAGDGETVFTRKYDTQKERIEAMHAELVRHVENLKDDDQWNAYLESLRAFHKYSFTNNILIRIQRPDATRVAGFNRWKDLGRTVRKGERGIAIFAPMIVKDKDAVDDENDPGRKLVGYRVVHVFDIEQTEGEPLPSIKEELSATPPDGMVDDLEAAVVAHGYTVSYESTGSAAHGYTDPFSKKVVVDPKWSPGSQAKTLAHELAHIAAGHTEQMDEYHTGHGGQRGRFEIEADSIACVLTQSLGFDPEVNETSATYVAGWSTTADGIDTIRQSAEVVSKTVSKLLKGHTWSTLAIPAESDYVTHPSSAKDRPARRATRRQ